MSVTLKSDLDQIAKRAAQGVKAANAASARKIAAAAAARAPRASGNLARSIVAVDGDGEDAIVEVGAWYGHLVEFGTVKTGARPFLVPAVEAERDNHRRAIRGLFQ